MEMNQVELKKLDDAAKDAAELALGELTDVQLFAVGGGCITANFS